MQSLCDCYLPSLWRFVYTRVGGDAHLAEDITSEAVLAMLTAIESGTEEAEILNPGGWLRTVAGRRVTDHFRAASRVQHLLEQVAGSHVAADSTDNQLREQALADEKVQAATSGHDIVKVIVVPRKLVNVVVK